MPLITTTVKNKTVWNKNKVIITPQSVWMFSFLKNKFVITDNETLKLLVYKNYLIKSAVVNKQNFLLTVRYLNSCFFNIDFIKVTGYEQINQLSTQAGMLKISKYNLISVATLNFALFKKINKLNTLPVLQKQFSEQVFTGPWVVSKSFNYYTLAYDTNNQYSSIMLKPYPTGIGRWVTVKDTENFFGFAKIKIKKKSEFVFSEELKYFKNPIKFQKSLFFNKKPLFLTFFQTKYPFLFKNRTIKKHLTASLYGKFASHSGPKHFEISSSITSYSRIYLYTISKKNNWFYSDTDSYFLKFPLNKKYQNFSTGAFKNIFNQHWAVIETYSLAERYYEFYFTNNELVLLVSKIKGFSGSYVANSFYKLVFNSLFLIKQNRILKFKHTLHKKKLYSSKLKLLSISN